MDKKYRALYSEIIEKIDTVGAKKNSIQNSAKTLKEAEEKLRTEYEKKELYEQKEVLERYFKRAEYKEKVEKKYEDFFRDSEE